MHQKISPFGNRHSMKKKLISFTMEIDKIEINDEPEPSFIDLKIEVKRLIMKELRQRENISVNI